MLLVFMTSFSAVDMHTRRYLVAADEKQSTFTAAQQRKGVYVIPHAVSGVFGLVGERPVPLNPVVLHKGRASRRSGSGGGGGGGGVGGGGGGGGAATALNATADSIFDAGEGDEEDLPSGFSFDWDAYHEAFGDTSLEDAVTAMFAEYATLYARIAGWATSTMPEPMTLDVAEALANDAAEFVLGFVKPLLGAVHTSKVHNLLRHLLDAIRMHGNLRNGNTGTNEAGHKVDKVFYNRTNKVIKTFTQQIVRQSQGSQAIVARNATLDATAAASSRRRVRLEPARPFRGVPRLSVATLSLRPGLSRLATLLGQPVHAKILVVGQVELAARLECGAPVKQTLRGSPSFRNGQAWFDAVQYEVPAAGANAQAQGLVALCYGEVRAILRYKEEDVVVMCKFKHVEGASKCPLVERLCTRLAWAFDEFGHWDLVAVPLSRVRRVVHVVPDFSDLMGRRGVKATPPSYIAPLEDLREMRYMVNDFYPWK